MNAPVPRILICDDHQLIREGFKRILIDGGIIGDVGEASNASEALFAVRSQLWDILILDINLGGRSGIEVLNEIRSQFPNIQVLILSAYPEDQFALRSMRAGARGYVNKNLATSTLVEAVRQVLAGGRYISAKVAEQFVDAVQDPNGRPLHSLLSDREDQVLRLIGAGNTVGKIAAQLSLSVKTISTYRTIVLRKLRLENNAQLMRYALEHDIKA